MIELLLRQSSLRICRLPVIGSFLALIEADRISLFYLSGVQIETLIEFLLAAGVGQDLAFFGRFLRRIGMVGGS